MFIRTIVILVGLMMLSVASAHDKGHKDYSYRPTKSYDNHFDKHNKKWKHHNGYRRDYYKGRGYSAYRPRRYVERCFPIYQFYVNGIGFNVVDDCGIRKRIYLDDRWNYAHPNR